MNIGYLLFMGLLCTTLILWAIVAIRDDGKGISEEDEATAEETAEDSKDGEQPVQNETSGENADEEQT